MNRFIISTYEVFKDIFIFLLGVILYFLGAVISLILLPYACVYEIMILRKTKRLAKNLKETHGA